MLLKRLTRGLLALLIIPLSCGGSSGDDSDPDRSTEDVIVILPDGSTATVEVVDASDYPDQDSLASPVFDIGPSGTTFDVPVTIGLPIDEGTPDGPVVVARYNETTDEWDHLPGSFIVATTVFAKTDHFSIFAALSAPQAAACDNLWTNGGPGTVAPLLVPGTITVTPGTKTEEVIQFSGPSSFAASSTWTSPGCTVTVEGLFGPGQTGDGMLIDYSNGGTTYAVPQVAGGAFSVTLNAPIGPFFGLADPCHAAIGGVPYLLNVHMTGDCGPVNPPPTPVPCGSGNNGKMIQGRCMVEVTLPQSGNDACAAEGMTCIDIPVLSPPEEACVAFNPTASVTSTGSGWQTGFYCDGAGGSACAGKTNNCHSCPPCTSNITCASTDPTNINRIYASCQ